MVKNLKLNIKNTQIAQALNLGALKTKLAKQTQEVVTPASEEVELKKSKARKAKSETEEAPKEQREEAVVHKKARSHSVFAKSENVSEEEAHAAKLKSSSDLEPSLLEKTEPTTVESSSQELDSFTEEARRLTKKQQLPPVEKLNPLEAEPLILDQPVSQFPDVTRDSSSIKSPPKKEIEREENTISSVEPVSIPSESPSAEMAPKKEAAEEERLPTATQAATTQKQAPPFVEPSQKLGPTGRHIKDLFPPQRPKPPIGQERKEGFVRPSASKVDTQEASSTATTDSDRQKAKVKPKGREKESETFDEFGEKKGQKGKIKEFRDVKPLKKVEPTRSFDARDRQGLRVSDDEIQWRKKRPSKQMRMQQEDTTIRPTHLNIRLPITLKDLANEMKLKSSQLIAKLFLQGMVLTLNDILTDETTVQLLGHEFGCEITIDTAEEKRIRITDKTIKEEIQSFKPEELQTRPPVAVFMGHVDHGKTSLIDTIRKSNRAAGEAGAITQHIGAFRCHTDAGDITILDTPGHEAFSAMRARGADVTDIVVLVVAGDEGMRQQTLEAIQHARAANAIIVVAINKSDKPNFNPENVYRQLADQNLLPEAWGGQIITVNCSAATGEGINTLLEMLALQAEVLELRANPNTRARGTVLESEMHKGLGAVTTLLVQNGTLLVGDSLVFGHEWARVKTMRNEFGRELKEAGPSTPVEITGLSALPAAGEEFVVVKNEKEARDIAETRRIGSRQANLQQKKAMSMESILQQASSTEAKKILNIILRADMQGSLEALKIALSKIESAKVQSNIIFFGVGDISESDVQLAAASKAIIVGFHTKIESHAESLVKQLGVTVRLHDIIYHAIDDVRALMTGLLDKIAKETDKGKAEVKAIFKSSQVGAIAGCQVIEGTVARYYHIRLKRNDQILWKGSMSSLKRVKEDVKEVQKGMECGILINYNDIQVGDILESYEVTYLTQEL